MSSLKTVSVLDQLPSPVTSYIIENVEDEFLSGYRIPDAFFNMRCTWFVLFEKQLIVIDSVKPFRVLDRFYIGDITAEEVTVDGSHFVQLVRDNDRDVYIQVDPSDSKSKLFANVIVEQVNALEEIEGDTSEFQFTI